MHDCNTMWQRSSCIELISVKLLTFTGVVQLGEAKYIDAHRITLAVQREQELFFGNEAPLELFQNLFEEPEFEPIYEDIRITFHHRNPCIHVKQICLSAVSNSGLLHIGNGDSINLESRTLHIRQMSGLNIDTAKVKEQVEIKTKMYKGDI